VIRTIAVVRIIHSVPSIVAIVADPVYVALSVVHGVLVRAVMAIRSRTT
jgi:hypothetical protein